MKVIALTALMVMLMSATPSVSALGVLNGTYDNCYNDDADYYFYWTVVGDRLDIGIEAKTTGWVAWGISPPGSGGMNGDAVLGGYAGDSQYKHDIWLSGIQDSCSIVQTSEGAQGACADSKYTGGDIADPWSSFTSREDTDPDDGSAITVIEFSRLWANDTSSDTHDVVNFNIAPATYIYGYSNTDAISGGVTEGIQKHSESGVLIVDLTFPSECADPPAGGLTGSSSTMTSGWMVMFATICVVLGTFLVRA